MKQLLGAFFAIILTQVAQAKTEFWCEPENHDSRIESVLAESEGDSHQLRVYLTSETWGAVDEVILNSKRTQSGELVNYKSEDGNLNVYTNIPYGDLAEFVKAEFSVPSQKFQINMICEINP